MRRAHTRVEHAVMRARRRPSLRTYFRLWIGVLRWWLRLDKYPPRVTPRMHREVMAMHRTARRIGRRNDKLRRRLGLDG